MSATWQFICFLIAFILFILAGLSVAVRTLNLVALGLAAFTLVFLWNAGAAM